MDRRELLKMIALLTGSAVIGSELFLAESASANAITFAGFTKADIALLDEVAETIIPRTKTPGAKDAAVGKFVTVMVTDCYTAKDQQVFQDGILKLNAASKLQFKLDFMKITPAQRHALLLLIDQEAKEAKKNKLTHYYIMMKQLTLLGYFTSEKGAIQALRFVPVPGRFESCIPYKKGDTAWAYN